MTYVHVIRKNRLMQAMCHPCGCRGLLEICYLQGDSGTSAGMTSMLCLEEGALEMKQSPDFVLITRKLLRLRF